MRYLRRRLIYAVALLTTALILPSLATAADRITGSPPTSPQFFLSQAREAQEEGRWADACIYYDAVLSLNRNQPGIKKEFLICLRNYHRWLRHQDAGYRQLFEKESKDSFSVSHAVDFYKEALRRVQENFVVPEKKTLTRLYQEGARELTLALNDADFRRKYVGKPEKVGAFLAFLAEQEKTTIPDYPEPERRFAKVEEYVRDVARRADRELHLDRRLVVMEFACGACNALDEYSFYLTQGSMRTSGTDDKSIDKVEFLPEGIGYIHLASFGDTTVQELEAAYEQLRASGMKVLILDIRDNAGGSLDVAAQVADRFFDRPLSIGSTSGKVKKEYRSYNKMNAFDVPMLLLIDGNTTSAAEFLALAFKVHDRAPLIGQTTYGKNWVQGMVTMNNAPYGAIRITWGQFYGPRGQDLSKTGGVAPTTSIAMSMGMRDPQLEEAMKRAQAMMGMR